MLEQLTDARAPVRIRVKQQLHPPLPLLTHMHPGAPVHLVFTFLDLLGQKMLVVIIEGQLAAQQSESDDADAPDVACLAVPLVF